MVGSQSSRAQAGASHAGEVAPVRPAADPHDVLARRSSEAHHYVPGLAAHGTWGRGRERQQAHQPAAPEDAHPPHRDTRWRLRRTRAEDVHRMPAPGKARREPAEIRLGAAAGELAVHERDAHHSRARSCSHSARRR